MNKNNPLERYSDESACMNQQSNCFVDETPADEQESEWQYQAALVGNGHTISCAYNAESLSARHITVVVADVLSEIYVLPTAEPNTYVAWMHHPGENTMMQMFTVQHLNDWDVASTVVERYLQALVSFLMQDTEEDVN
jgi:hypothetical protein